MPPTTLADPLSLLTGLGVPALSAVAVILTVKLFLARMRDSQILGHEVAKDLANQYRENLALVTQSHTQALVQLAQKQEKLANAVHELTIELRSGAARREANK